MAVGVQLAIQISFHVIGMVVVIWGIGDRQRKLLLAGVLLMVLSSVMMPYDSSFQIRESASLYGPAILIFTIPVAVSLGIVLNRYFDRYEPETEPLSADDIEDEFE